MTDNRENKQPRSAGWPTPSEGDVLLRLAEMVRSGEDGVLATVVSTQHSAPRHAGSKMIVHSDGSLTGTVGGGGAEALVIAEASTVRASGQCRLVPIDLNGGQGVCGGTMDVFLEPVLRATPFVVVGAGHVGRAMTAVGRTLGFRFTLVDDRAEFLATVDDERVQTVLAGPSDLGSALGVEPRASVFVCSRNHTLDGDYLEALIRLEIASDREFVFFGSLGSRAKAARLRRRLQAVPELAERMGRVRLPVGINIGAESPAEIALSVLAEAQAVLRGVPLVRAEDGTLGYPLQGQKP